MSCLLQNVICLTNDSQKMLVIELKVEKSDLKPGSSFRSEDFNAVGKDMWFFQLTLSRRYQISLYLRSRNLVDVNICYTSMVFDEDGESLHGHSSSFNLKDVLYINMLQGFTKSSSTLHFPLTVTCYLLVQNVLKEVTPVQNSNQGIIPVPIQNTDLKVALNQKADKEMVSSQNTVGEVVTNINKSDNISVDCLQELSVNLKKLLDQAIGADITMQVDGVSMKAHKMILRVRSQVFDKMFDHDTSEAAQNEIDIKDIRAPTMKELLTFLYTGTKKNYDFDDACDLYYAADKYEVLSLRNACKKDLLHHLQAENACQLLILANNHGDETFKEEIMKFIETNFKTIVATKSFEELAKYDANLVVLLMRNHMLSKSE